MRCGKENTESAATASPRYYTTAEVMNNAQTEILHLTVSTLLAKHLARWTSASVSSVHCLGSNPGLATEPFFDTFISVNVF